MVRNICLGLSSSLSESKLLNLNLQYEIKNFPKFLTRLNNNSVIKSHFTEVIEDLTKTLPWIYYHWQKRTGILTLKLLQKNNKRYISSISNFLLSYIKNYFFPFTQASFGCNYQTKKNFLNVKNAPYSLLVLGFGMTCERLCILPHPKINNNTVKSLAQTLGKDW